jgi:hypothetical protein
MDCEALELVQPQTCNSISSGCMGVDSDFRDTEGRAFLWSGMFWFPTYVLFFASAFVMETERFYAKG